jgi:hypothetical protein
MEVDIQISIQQPRYVARVSHAAAGGRRKSLKTNGSNMQHMRHENGRK